MSLNRNQVLSISITVLSVLAGASAQLTTIFGSGLANSIISGAALLNAILSSVLMVFTSQSGIIQSAVSMPGVESIKVNAQANQTLAAIAVDPAQQKVSATTQDQGKVIQIAKTAIIVFAAVLGTLTFLPMSASAAPKLVPPTGHPVADIENALNPTAPNSVADKALTALAKPFQDIVNFIGADLDGAVTLSIATDIKDGHGQQCWIALRSFSKIFKAHPLPLTLKAATDFESLRLLGIATNQLCTNVHCTQVFADASAMAQAASPVPLVIPSLHDLCTKVPQIAVVDPVPLPADMLPAVDVVPAPLNAPK